MRHSYRQLHFLERARLTGLRIDIHNADIAPFRDLFMLCHIRHPDRQLEAAAVHDQDTRLQDRIDRWIEQDPQIDIVVQ